MRIGRRARLQQVQQGVSLRREGTASPNGVARLKLVRKGKVQPERQTAIIILRRDDLLRHKRFMARHALLLGLGGHLSEQTLRKVEGCEKGEVIG